MGAFAVIYEENSRDSGRVLLCRLSYVDLWSLPGGGVDHGETPVEAVVREVKEETGLDARVRRLVGVDTKSDGNLVFCFECEVTGGELTTSEETLEFGYFAPGGFPAESSEAQRRRVMTACKNLPEPVFNKVRAGIRVGDGR